MHPYGTSPFHSGTRCNHLKSRQTQRGALTHTDFWAITSPDLESGRQPGVTPDPVAIPLVIPHLCVVALLSAAQLC